MNALRLSFGGGAYVLEESGIVDRLHREYSQYDPIRQIERLSIRMFMEENRQYLRGRVLDFGAGTQPYRDLVEGLYVPVEKGQPTDGFFDAVMCNQVLQYTGPLACLYRFHQRLNPRGYLVLTYATNWDEVEHDDCLRITKAGMEDFITNGASWHLIKHERRAEVRCGNFCFPLGYGLVAQRV